MQHSFLIHLEGEKMLSVVDTTVHLGMEWTEHFESAAKRRFY